MTDEGKTPDKGKTLHQKKKIWFVLPVVLFFLVTGVWYFFCVRKAPEVQEKENKEPERVFGTEVPSPTAALPTQKTLPRMIYVYVCGAVCTPGVYELPEGSRLFEGIALAGGSLPDADEAYHNLARELSDGERVYILSKEESAGLSVKERVDGETLTKEENSMGESDRIVNLNTATVEQLTGLPGIGEARAKDIIAYRNKVGRFLDTKEIMNVSGIGEAMFEKIKDRITVE